MKFETIELHKEDGTAIIILNRPHRLNTINEQLVTEVREAVFDIEKDENIHVFIITGAPRPDGRPCFSAGGDIKDLPNVPYTFQIECQDLFNRIEDNGKPSIAAIDGVCTAGGIEVALACDIRLAAHSAQISDFHLKNLGGHGGAGATTRLAKLIGAARTKELIFTGSVLGGEEACRIGLVNHVYASEYLMAEAKAMAKSMASMRMTGVRMTKAAINVGSSLPLHEALRFEDRLRLWMGEVRYERGSTPGHIAFRENRRPEWTD